MDELALIVLGAAAASGPAKLLIQKVFDVIEGFREPGQIVQRAEAQAEANKISLTSEIELTKLEQRAFRRLRAEEAKKQHNIENITRKAIPNLDEEADAT